MSRYCKDENEIYEMLMDIDEDKNSSDHKGNFQGTSNYDINKAGNIVTNLNDHLEVQSTKSDCAFNQVLTSVDNNCDDKIKTGRCNDIILNDLGMKIDNSIGNYNKQGSIHDGNNICSYILDIEGNIVTNLNEDVQEGEFVIISDFKNTQLGLSNIVESNSDSLTGNSNDNVSVCNNNVCLIVNDNFTNDNQKDSDNVGINTDKERKEEDYQYNSINVEGNEENKNDNNEEIYSGNDEDTFQETNPSTKKRTRWNKPNPKEWKRNVIKRKRSECLPYETKKGPKNAKKPKTANCKSCRFKCCENFSEEDRDQLCLNYWNLSYDRQKDFILANVSNVIPKRRNTNATNPKGNSRIYFFTKNNTKFRVCKTFFLKSLCISHGPVETALQNRSGSGEFAGKDRRGSKTPINKTSDDKLQTVKSHIEKFPVMESHYVRKSSQRKYLDYSLSIRKMYALYKEECETNSEEFVSEITYRRVFSNNYNYSFFTPKKDQCSICNKYNIASLEDKINLEEDYKNHIRRKNEANSLKEMHKIRSETDKSFISSTFDLQSVLQIPSFDVSPLYYSRKICCYNFTIYEAPKPNNALCYVWTEMDGKRGSSEIGTNILEYLQNLPTSIKEVSFISDTCGGQNRNRNVAAMFLYAVQHTNIEVVEHNFLESGHSHMEVDSMHSAVESAKKSVPVYTVQDWLTIIRLARSKRKNKNCNPYKVRKITFNEFYNLSGLAQKTMINRTTDVNGKKVKWLKIKAMRYEKKQPGIILFKYNFSDAYSVLRVNGVGRPKTTTVLEKLYTKLLPISIAKKKDLNKLCRSGVIPNEFHGWYSSLPTSKTARNCVPEPNSDTDTEHEDF